MRTAAQSLLHAFDRLSKDEQREVASEILGRILQIDYPPLDGETLSRRTDEPSYGSQEFCAPIS
ncbi:MAG: hypothetical protein JO329_26640 [Planctomycetaceae bacterium]|nr:hypothetical protein [Planctomycetaceae bacterium]